MGTNKPNVVKLFMFCPRERVGERVQNFKQIASLGQWEKVWVKPSGCVVKVFPREISKDIQEDSEGFKEIF